jgi:hypothetical protein
VEFRVDEKKAKELGFSLPAKNIDQAEQARHFIDPWLCLRVDRLSAPS